MAENEQEPIASFRSTIFGNNVVVEVFNDRVQFGKPGPKMSTGQRVALGSVTGGYSVIFTGLNKKDSELTVIPIEMIDSVEVVARGAKEKAKHLSNAGVFPGRGNWKSSTLMLTVAGHSIEIPVEKSEAESTRALISDFASSRRQQLRSSEGNSSSVSVIAAESSASHVADELKKLHELHQLGALTEEEFVAQKSKLLGS